MIDFFSLLKSNKLLFNIRAVDGEPSCYDVSYTTYSGDTLDFRFCFDAHFPRSLPQVRILTEVGKLPHIFENQICYIETEGQSWSSDPELALLFVLENIDNIFNIDNITYEYHREFNVYFEKEITSNLFFSIFQLTDYVKKVASAKYNDITYFCDLDENSKKALQNIIFKEDIHYYEETVFIPLKKKYVGPILDSNFFSYQKNITKLILCHIGYKNLRDLLKIKKNKRYYKYIICLKLLTNEKVIFGIRYEKSKKSKLLKKTHPIIANKYETEFTKTPFVIQRYDKVHLCKRLPEDISEAKVLIIGCGSLGSDIAFLLARSGINHLTFVDNKRLRPENSYRHFLGLNYSRFLDYKVEALRKELTRRYPYCEIKCFSNDVFSIIGSDLDLKEYDLIISAIGEPNKNKIVNEYLITSSVPYIITWIEAYGIGGHALYINPEYPGCFECLFDDIQNKEAFAIEGEQPFVKNTGGCAGAFTPYGSVSVMETATMAANITVDFLNSSLQIQKNALYSWRGNPKELLANGHKLSDRFKNAYNSKNMIDEDFINSACKICSVGAKDGHNSSSQ